MLTETDIQITIINKYTVFWGEIGRADKTSHVRSRGGRGGGG